MTRRRSNAVLLGIDLGTTVLKVCAFDARTGDLLAQGARRLPVLAPEEAGREQSLRSLDRAFGGILKDLRGVLGTRWQAVCGVGVAAQGGSSILADRATGKPLTPMVLWNDGRTHAHAARVAEGRRAAFWQRHVLRDVPPAGLGRLLWLREKHASLFTPDHIHIGAGEYLFHRLTGVWRQDSGNAIQIGSYDAVRQRLTPKLLRLVDLPLDFVAPLRKGHETAPLSAKGARLLGLPEGIPVAGPYIDQEAGYLAAASGSKRPLQCSLGTAWVGNYTCAREDGAGSPYQLVLASPLGAGDLVVQPLLTGNTNWDWALTSLVDSDHERALSQANRVFGKRLLPPYGHTAVPYFAQRNMLDADAYGSGGFFGLSVETGRDDMLRAVAAGMVFEFARVFEPVAARGLVDRVVLGGGASKGAFFRALLAAVMHPLPVVWQIDEDLCAARGSIYAFSRKAAHANTRRVPKPAKKIRDEAARHVALYREVVARLGQGDAVSSAVV
ncbi:MAG: FGGY-family carbohydrate kinase [bacterium]|nr:FGGY-family carbohydrate kinase [bacterium]